MVSPTSHHRHEAMNRVTKDELQRVARIYKSNKEASIALGIHAGTFARLCRKHGILTPYVRQRQARNGKDRSP